MLPRRKRHACELTSNRIKAWEKYVNDAYFDPEILAAFHAATGLVVSTLRRQHEGPPTSRERFRNVETFVDWVTEHRWGLDRGPPEVKARIAAAKVKAERSRG